jgi:hypothetical protein
LQRLPCRRQPSPRRPLQRQPHRRQPSRLFRRQFLLPRLVLPIRSVRRFSLEPSRDLPSPSLAVCEDERPRE